MASVTASAASVTATATSVAAAARPEVEVIAGRRGVATGRVVAGQALTDEPAAQAAVDLARRGRGDTGDRRGVPRDGGCIVGVSCAEIDVAITGTDHRSPQRWELA